MKAHKRNLYRCAGCGKPIKPRRNLTATDGHYHAICFRRAMIGRMVMKTIAPLIIAMMLIGCQATASHAIPEQRTDDLEWPCYKCGEPTQQDTNDGGDSPRWECEKCSPYNERHKLRPHRPRPRKSTGAIWISERIEG